MKMICLILALLVSLLCIGTTHAQTFVSHEDATEAASCYVNWLRTGSPKQEKLQETGYKTHERDGRVLIHEVHIDSFKVWVSGVKSCLPILAYNVDTSASYMLDVGDEHGLSYFIERYSLEIEYSMDSLVDKGLIHSGWDELFLGYTNQPKAPVTRAYIEPCEACPAATQQASAPDMTGGVQSMMSHATDSVNCAAWITTEDSDVRIYPNPTEGQLTSLWRIHPCDSRPCEDIRSSHSSQQMIKIPIGTISCCIFAASNYCKQISLSNMKTSYKILKNSVKEITECYFLLV